MSILLVAFPLFGFLGGIACGHFLGLGVLYLTTFLIFLSFIISLFLLAKVVSTGIIIKVVLGAWFFVDSLNVEWTFCFDSLTSVMLVVVTFISFLVHVYSTEYMKHDPHVIRFMS